MRAGLSTDQTDRLNATMAGRYTIERMLGSGGTAVVYLATDVRHGRQVALKILRPELAEALGPDRFLREIRIAARLNHPHILPLYDSGEADGFLFYVMPYVKGETLRDRMRRERQLPIDAALEIARQIASALEYAHGQGVLHRDIKPENILLHEGVALVADFGIALPLSQRAQEGLTQTGMVLGTLAYMSPEQATGGTLDARCDVYSLSCVLYEMLAGEPPYPGSAALAMIARRLTQTVPSVRRLRSDVPMHIGRALERGLAPLPADRFHSAAQFAEALAAPAGARTRTRSVAVLPFVNLSADPENEYFADGITEDVIAHLSKAGSLKVISRTSVMAFKNRVQSLREIGAQLNAATLLEGSVRRAGDRVRIVAQLIDADTDEHLWAETYDRQLTDIFAIQTDVALHIAAALKMELAADEQQRMRKQPTRSVEAYQLYLQGRYCFFRFTEEGVRKSIEYFEQAIARDPEYALAYTGLALACAELQRGLGGGIPQEHYRRALDAVRKALALDPALGEAHCILGLLRFVHDYDWAGAEQAFRRSLELNPGNADTWDLFGQMLSAVGRYDEAIAMTRRAQELDPLAHRSDLPSTLLRAGRYDEALEMALQATRFDPQYARAQSALAWAYLLKGRVDEGLATLQKAVALSNDSLMFVAQLGQAYAMTGRTDQARDVLRRLQERARTHYVSPYYLAYVYTGLGEADAALDCLERAFEDRGGNVSGIKGSFLFASLRSHPRFKTLLARMNLAGD